MLLVKLQGEAPLWAVERARTGSADLEFPVSKSQEVLPVVLPVNRWFHLFFILFFTFMKNCLCFGLFVFLKRAPFFIRTYVGAVSVIYEVPNAVTTILVTTSS